MNLAETLQGERVFTTSYCVPTILRDHQCTEKSIQKTSNHTRWQFDLWIFAFFVSTNFSRQLSAAILLPESSSMIPFGAWRFSTTSNRQTDEILKKRKLEIFEVTMSIQRNCNEYFARWRFNLYIFSISMLYIKQFLLYVYIVDKFRSKEDHSRFRLFP